MPIKPDSPDVRPEAFKRTKMAYYGAAQEMFHVEQGDVWGANRSRFLCGDVLKLDEAGLLDRHIGEVDVIYTDPPWSDLIFKTFYHYASTRPPVQFNHFFKQFIPIIKRLNPNGIIFVESGISAKELIISELERSGAHTLSIINCTYTKMHVQYVLWVGSYNGTVTLPSDLLKEGRHEGQVVLSISYATAKKGIKFYDPLCGQMQFILPAARLGADVFGSELIPRKFAEGLRQMKQSMRDIRLIDKNVIPT